MEFLRKRFRRGNPAAVVGHSLQEEEKADENPEESFAILQFPEESYDPQEYDQPQICRCYDSKTDTEAAPHHEACRRHLEPEDQGSVKNVVEKGNMNASTNCVDQAVVQNRESVRTQKCHGSCADSSDQGNHEVSAVFRVDSLIENAPEQGWDRREGYCTVEDPWSEPRLQMENCAQNDKLSLTSTSPVQVCSCMKISQRSRNIGQELQEGKKTESCPEDVTRSELTSEEISRGNEERTSHKGFGMEEGMLSSGSSTSSESLSVSSAPSATRGSYTLWPSSDGEDPSHCSGDVRDDYFTPESTLRRTNCSCENLSNCEPPLPNLERKLEPHLKDFKSDELFALLDLQVMKKGTPVPLEHIEAVGWPEAASSPLKNRDHCDPGVEVGVDCSQGGGITVENSTCFRNQNLETTPSGQFGNHLGGKVGDMDKGDEERFNSGIFSTSSPKSIRGSPPISDDDIWSRVIDTPKSCQTHFPSDDIHHPGEHSHTGKSRSDFQSVDPRRKSGSLHNTSDITCIPSDGPTHESRSSGEDFENYHTPTAIDQPDRTLQEDDSSLFEQEHQRSASDVGSLRTADDISFSSHYDTCTSTLDGFLIYDGSFGFGEHFNGVHDPKKDLNNTERDEMTGDGCYRKTPMVKNNDIPLREDVSITNCPMCGNVASFEHDREADRQAKEMNGNYDREPIQGRFLAPAILTRTASPPSPLTRGEGDVDGASVLNGRALDKRRVDTLRQGGGLFMAKEAPRSGSSTNHRHVAEALANNAAAVILLLDHKMCERSWMLNDAGLNASSQNLPDGFSYGDEVGGEPQRMSGADGEKMVASSDESKTKAKLEHRRSRSFGSSVSRAITDAVNKLEEISHESRNKQYHKLFKFIPEEEGLIVSFSCALVRDILLQGRLYLSENWVCFHSNIFTFETQVTVSMEEIQNITKERTAFVVPNAIGIQTENNKYVFGSLLSRHSTYKQLLKVWKKSHVLDETTSQESGSRLGSERDGLDVDEIPTEEGEDADIEEDADGGLRLRIDHQEDHPQCDVHVHQHPPDSQEGSIPSRRGSNAAKQMKPSKAQFFLAQILSLFQAVLAIGIYKSLKRFVRHQPFFAVSVLMFSILSISAMVMGYKVLTFQSEDQHLFQDAYHEISSLGHVLLSHHQSKHDKVSRLQDKLSQRLESMIIHQTDQPNSGDDEGS